LGKVLSAANCRQLHLKGSLETVNNTGKKASISVKSFPKKEYFETLCFQDASKREGGKWKTATSNGGRISPDPGNGWKKRMMRIQETKRGIEENTDGYKKRPSRGKRSPATIIEG